MKIWILWRGNPDDDNDLLGAFTTEELAKGRMEEVYRTAYKEEYDGIMVHPIEGKSMISPDFADIDDIDEYFDRYDRECWIDTIKLEGPIDAAI